MAQHIKSVVPDHPASVAVLKHALAVLLNMFFIIAFTVVVALFTGKVREVVSLMAAFAFLRQMTGGVHLKSGMGCVLVSVLLFTVLSYVEFNHVWTTGATVVSMFLILLYAPAGIENQTRIPPRYFPLLKVAALIVVGCNFWFVNPVTAAGFLAQSLSLISLRRWRTS
ncbi:accessory gene regulator ArgB-like protein [Paenibacillus sp. NRS-1781]|uniref:accessory gene regulator ArgB-like protein n=1 Tax=Paenibacillus sp. NRS-1781 TaxID=3233905 RepID=UPI003D27AF1A